MLSTRPTLGDSLISLFFATVFHTVFILAYDVKQMVPPFPPWEVQGSNSNSTPTVHTGATGCQAQPLQGAGETHTSPCLQRAGNPEQKSPKGKIKFMSQLTHTHLQTHTHIPFGASRRNPSDKKVKKSPLRCFWGPPLKERCLL